MIRSLLVGASLSLLLWCCLVAPPALAADAHLKVTVTNGADTAGESTVEVRPAGQHNGDVITYGGSGDELTAPAGSYDVGVRYSDGAASKVIWFDRLTLSGRIEKTVDMGLPVAALHIVITNGGTDVADKGVFEVRPAGQHGADVIAYQSSGGTVRVAAGTYDVDVRLQDGAVDKTVWLDGLALSGTVDKAVDVGASAADLTWHITNHGEDVGAQGTYRIRPAGRHDGDVIAWGTSGQQIRLPAGDYDVEINLATGLATKTIWLDRQSLRGKVDRTTELALNLVRVTLSASLDGADAGNKARIGITPAGQDDEVGAVQGGETALLEAGRYKLTATIPGAEGTLPDTPIEAQAHLTVPMKALRSEELKVGGPAPKECTIEVYGVNFDFDKASLRPDSTPVLQAVLQLFKASPAFGAEVGGHTDNVGKPDYNLKLSEARAAAVKAWLAARGVAADRVSSHGYGDTHPLVPNDTDANRFKNRRVELRRTHCG